MKSTKRATEADIKDDDELMFATDPRTQLLFADLEREGEIRRVDWTRPDRKGRVFPCYERVPPRERVQAILDSLERDGLIVRDGLRRGKPVYTAACNVRRKSNRPAV